MGHLASPVEGSSRYQHHGDYNVLAARLGWLPSYPTFEKNGIELYKEAVAAGATTQEEIGKYVAQKLKRKRTKICD